MSVEIGERDRALRAILTTLDDARVAVSGGVDSMTLAHCAHATLGARVLIVHAVSPAVPPAATERVRAYAAEHGWTLEVIDAGEFDDPDYRANPVNRCFHCKTALYGSIARRFGGTILSGTNLDDLGDYRPGLKAAAAHAVRHPYVEAGIDKDGVRALARYHGLPALAALPAAPCLSSRILTGLAVTEPRLAGILAIETAMQRELGGDRTLRCRVVEQGVDLQLDEPALRLWHEGAGERLRPEVDRLCRLHGLGTRVDVSPYRRGSAFVGDKRAPQAGHAV